MSSFKNVLKSYLTESQLAKIGKITVGIAGCGGLGSNVAQMLVRSGFEDLVIADFDVVELSNLNRQFYFIDQIGRNKVDALEENLELINPEAKITKHNTKIGYKNACEIFKDCDIVVEAFDNKESKKEIIDALSETTKYVISASGIGGYDDRDSIVTAKVNEKLWIVGDGKTEVNKNNPPLAPRVIIASAKQADLVLKIVFDIIK